MAHTQCMSNDQIVSMVLQVTACCAEVANLTMARMSLQTELTLKTLEQTIRIAQTCSGQVKKFSHPSNLEEVLEEHEDEFQRDSQTKECLGNIFQKNEVIQEILKNENSNPNLPQTLMEPFKKEIPCEAVEDFNVLKNSAPKKRKSMLSEQLSQIKVDKVKEAEEERKLMEFVSTIDPLEVLPKIEQMEMLEEQGKAPSILMFPDHTCLFVDPTKQESLLEHEPLSPWYNSSVEYKATSYHTNESSNMHNHSYQWNESKEKNDDFLKEYGIQFESSVFDYPYPQKFNEASQQKMQRTPKKPRLYCQDKKIPHWAEDIKVVSKHQQKQPNHTQIFGVAQKKLMVVSQQLSERQRFRGSSAQWQHASNIMNNHLQKLILMQDDNKQKMKQFLKESVKKKKGFFASTKAFFTSVKKQLLSSFEKKKWTENQ